MVEVYGTGVLWTYIVELYDGGGRWRYMAEVEGIFNVEIYKISKYSGVIHNY